MVRYWDCLGSFETGRDQKGRAAMMSTAPLSFDQANEEVEGMIHRGTAFDCVEEAIDAAEFSRHHKAALWLLAWSLRDPAIQRRDARVMAEAFAADG
jgi:hypothetical protein